MFSKSTLLAIAAAITAVAEDIDSGTNETSSGEAPPKRGRPAGSKNAPAAAAPEPEKPVGKTYEQLQALIKPLIEATRQPEVKAAIVKFAPTLAELAKLPQHHAAFEQEIENMSL